MSMTPADLIRYRIERAAKTLEEADMLAQTGSWNGCANRLYYACFYAVSAVMARDGVSSSKHTGVRAFLNRHYIHTGRIEPDLGKFYNQLFDTRLDGDYEDFVAFDDEKVRPLITEARRFVARIEELLR
ncbi:MAG: HEPN domain-containing protein [Thermomicrobia bacterium]|nr:HEPN domain-containing protein [Thermomicrobia bacterium]